MKLCEDNYYDWIYENSEVYQCHYRVSPYFPLWKALISFIKEEWKIVDLGCGPGQFAEYLRDLGFRYYLGIDFSRVAIETAEKKFVRYDDFRFIMADLRTCPIPEADCYVLCETLEHLENDATLLSKLPEGKVIVGSVPSFDCKGHVRFFGHMDEVKERYEKYINFEKLEMINPSHYVFKGKTKKENPQ